MALRSISVLFAAAGLAACSCAAPPLPSHAPIAVAPATLARGEWRVIDNVFVVTDASGTMYREQTFPLAKALSQSFVAALPGKGERARNSGRYNLGTIGFGGVDRMAYPLSAFDRGAARATVDAVRIMGSADGRGGTTPLGDVLGEIAAQLEAQAGPAAVVVFSDGGVEDGAATLGVAEQLNASQPGGVCFHSVQLGNNAQGEQFLRGLAAASGSCGSYRNSSTLGSGSALSAFAKRVVAGSAPSQPHEAAGAKPRVPLGNACEGVTLRGVEFATNKADLIGDSSAILSAATEQLRNCPGVALRVEGHTDSRGNAEYNQRLSERRATRVRRYLEAEGISAARLSSVGVSETTPVATNDTADGRQRNRRVDLVPN